MLLLDANVKLDLLILHERLDHTRVECIVPVLSQDGSLDYVLDGLISQLIAMLTGVDEFSECLQPFQEMQCLCESMRDEFYIWQIRMSWTKWHQSGFGEAHSITKLLDEVDKSLILEALYVQIGVNWLY